jgi:hypothetical protein
VATTAVKAAADCVLRGADLDFIAAVLIQGEQVDLRGVVVRTKVCLANQESGQNILYASWDFAGGCPKGVWWLVESTKKGSKHEPLSLLQSKI